MPTHPLIRDYDIIGGSKSKVDEGNIANLSQYSLYSYDWKDSKGGGEETEAMCDLFFTVDERIGGDGK